MWKNYLKVAVRNIVRDKGFSFINVLGLAAGMAASFLILSYVRHELSYDRYHPQADRISRVVEELRLERASYVTATTPAPFAPAMAAEFSEVRAAARFVRPHPNNDKVVVECANVPYDEDGLFFADATVFDVFSLPLLQGDPRTALRNPLSVVITESTAGRYFGTEAPLGKTLTIHFWTGKADFQVMGVLRDVPENSHLRFNLLASFASWENSLKDAVHNWFNHQYYTYLLLAPGANGVP